MAALRKKSEPHGSLFFCVDTALVMAAMMAIVPVMADAIFTVNAAVGGDDRPVCPVAVAAMHDGFAAGRAVGGYAGVLACLTNGILDGFAEFVQRVAVVFVGQRSRGHEGRGEGENQDGSDAAGQ